jgi:hypothetical protein
MASSTDNKRFSLWLFLAFGFQLPGIGASLAPGVSAPKLAPKTSLNKTHVDLLSNVLQQSNHVVCIVLGM